VGVGVMVTGRFSMVVVYNPSRSESLLRRREWERVPGLVGCWSKVGRWESLVLSCHVMSCHVTELGQSGGGDGSGTFSSWLICCFKAV